MWCRRFRMKMVARQSEAPTVERIGITSLNSEWRKDDAT